MTQTKLASPPAEVSAAPGMEEIARAAATSLETISQLAGRKTYGDPPIKTFMDTFMDVRLYAAARAKAARDALASLPSAQPVEVEPPPMPLGMSMFASREDYEAAAHSSDPTDAQMLEQAAEWLEEAAADIADWAAYASDYFQQKHNLAGDVALVRERAALLRARMKKEG